MTEMKLSLEDNAFKQAFLEGKLVIDGLEITLTQNGASEPRLYKLVGSLFVSPDNGVEARLLWGRDADHPFDLFASFKAMQRIQSGVIFPDDHYFSLRAVDTAGRVWTHPAVNLKRVELQQAEVLTISCDFIQVELDIDKKLSLVHFVFHDDLGIRMNVPHSTEIPVRNQRQQTTSITAAKGNVDGFEVDYYPVIADMAKTAHEFSAVAKPGISPPNHFDARLLEALQFAVAKMAWPIMREVIQAGKQTITLSKSRPFNNGIVGSALPNHAQEDFYSLIECFYRYALSEADGEDAAPLSKKVGGLFTLKGVWLDTVALLLGVAVESLLNESIYKSLGVPNEVNKTKIQSLIEYVGKAPHDANLTDRARQILGGMKSSSASDRLHILASAGVISKEDIKAWKSIRNAAAHGGLEVDPTQVQSLIESVYRLVAMVYKLAFVRIGYQGAYLDFSSRGWPLAQFDSAAYNERLEKLKEPPEDSDQTPTNPDRKAGGVVGYPQKE